MGEIVVLLVKKEDNKNRMEAHRNPQLTETNLSIWYHGYTLCVYAETQIERDRHMTETNT